MRPFFSQAICMVMVGFAVGIQQAPAAGPELNAKARAFPLHDAVKAGEYQIVAELLKASPSSVNATNDSGETPLHWAAVSGNIEIARALADAGADIGAKAKDDWTPLHWATVKGHKDIIRLLIERKADVNCRTRDQWTPLHVAAYQENREVIELLLASGADRAAKDINGLTPAETFAEKCKPIATILAVPGLAGKSEILSDKPADDTAVIEDDARLRARIVLLERENAELRRRADAAATNMAQRSSSGWSADHIERDQEIATLRSQLQAATARVAELERQVKTAEEIQAEGEKIRKTMSEMADRARTQAALSNSQSEIRAMEDKLAALEAAVKQAYEASQASEKRAESAAKARDELAAKLKALAAEMEKSDAGRQAAEADARSLKDQVANLESELREARLMVNQMRTQFIIASRERAQLKAALAEARPPNDANIPDQQ